MEKKKRFKVIISTLLVLCVFALISVVGVMAFDDHGVTSPVNVGYNAGKNVVGEVSATYQIGSGNVQNMVYDTDKTVITLTGSETANINKTLSPTGDITLTKENQYVVFAYSFNAKGAVDDYTASLTYTDVIDADSSLAEDSNIKVETSLNNTQWTEVTDLSKALISQSVTADDNQSTPVIVYVKVSIDNILLDAEFSGNFIWSLVAA